jgi:asparagine synthase (glutamine-hydrolysing)
VCGIVGVIDTLRGHVAPDLIISLARMMHARGPDGTGLFFDGAVGMAMRRLSIIDLAGGWQPFYSRGDLVVAFQNGEIYNYRALKKQLEQRGYRFASDCDSEVLAHGYAEWGPARLVEKLDGMFAIAILDRERRELHLARDRFGEKPLFFTQTRGRFAYCSDLLVLASLPWVDDGIHAESLDAYLGLHYVPGPATIFKAIRRVLPGERLVVPIDDPAPQRVRYYRPSLSEAVPVSDGDLAEAVVDAVESRLVADVPVGVFLSGGLDSSIVAAIAATKQARIATFSMGFRATDHDESAHAAAVAGAIGSDHHRFWFDENTFLSLVPQVARALDEPVGDQALLPLYWLCGEARRHVAVVLSGEGADEVFAGYGYYRANARCSDWQRLVDNPEPVTPSGFPLLTDRAERNRLLPMERSSGSEWETELAVWLNGARDPLRRATAADLATWLPDDLLVKYDRMAMAHSLEGRAPYLSPRVVEAGLSLLPKERLSGTDCKVALRRIGQRWLPRDILDRPKQGFVLPMRGWLRQWFHAKGSVQEYFMNRAVPGLDLVELGRLVGEDLNVGVRRERLLFALVLLVEWYTSFQARRLEHIAVHRDILVI